MCHTQEYLLSILRITIAQILKKKKKTVQTLYMQCHGLQTKILTQQLSQLMTNQPDLPLDMVFFHNLPLFCLHMDG